jgi:hypothetical protein
MVPPPLISAEAVSDNRRVGGGRVWPRQEDRTALQRTIRGQDTGG